jgi:hypothetical protein
MTLITLVCCLLALSSSAFGRSAYGSFPSTPVSSFGTVGGMRDLIVQQKPFMGPISTSDQLPLQTGYGQQTTSGLSSLTPTVQQDTTIQAPRLFSTFSTGYGSSYGGQDLPRKPLVMQSDQTFVGTPSQINLPMREIKSPLQLLAEQQQLLQDKIRATQVVTEADTYCRDQRPETVIPLDEGRRFIVCLDNGKGVEQFCPKGLLYNQDLRRCERKISGDPCAIQPCLNGGQCVRTDVSSFKCQCLAGFDGSTCESDARVCQTQQPCGPAPDTKCQSFRWGAALQYICILQDGRAYGLNAQQAQPNPCQGVDGPQPLAFTDKGFILCDGERMFIESCPGGTVWDDLNKACVWPDMQGLVTPALSTDLLEVSKLGYGRQPSYDQSKLVSPYGGSKISIDRPSFDQTKFVSSYGGSQVSIERPSFDLPKLVSPYGGSQISIDRPSFDQPKLVSSYGGSQVSVEQPFVQKPLVQEQKLEFQFPQEQQTVAYGGQEKPVTDVQKPFFTNPNREILKPQIWQQPIQRQQDFRPMQQDFRPMQQDFRPMQQDFRPMQQDIRPSQQQTSSY